MLGLLETGLRWSGYGFDPHFFKPLRIDGRDYFVQNEDFSFQFFPRAMVRNPGPIRFSAQKDPAVCRIFILGESAAMGDPAESFAPDRYLERLLASRYPERKFEVINTGVTAINSHVILPIARDCARHQGDIWIIYMGNNEMVGPYGAATVFGRQAPPLAYARFQTAIQHWRLGQWLVEQSRSVAAREKPAATWGGMEMFSQNQVLPGAPARERVYQNFQANLDAIIQLGTSSGATVILNTVGVNLRDCPPFGSVSRAAIAGTRAAAFSAAFTNALNAAARQNWAAAGAACQVAANYEPQSADLEYLWGQSLLGDGQTVAATAHLIAAGDLDTLPFRADSRINQIIRTAGERHPAPRLTLCDAAKILGSGLPGGLCGAETFFEHVHFDVAPRYRLARAWAEAIAPLWPASTNTWLTPEQADAAVGLTPWNEAQMLHLMAERMTLPPLSRQANNELRRTTLEERIKARLNALPANASQRALEAFRAALAAHPADFFLHENAAVFLELTGQPEAAVAEWSAFRDLLPQDPLGYYEAGRLEVLLGKYAEAEAQLRQAQRIRPSRTDGWIELGNALALQQKYTNALTCYDTALRQSPNDPVVLVRHGRVQLHLQQIPAALRDFQIALQINPANALAHHELGLALTQAGQSSRAGEEFHLAAQLNPDSAMYLFDYATWLFREQRWPEARQAFAEVLRVEPGNQRAQKHLAWLQTRLASPR